MSIALTDFLRTVAIFSDLREDEIEQVVPLLHPVALAPGEQLFSEGDPGETLYVVERGECSISVRLPDG